jgi:hypothetical protein
LISETRVLGRLACCVALFAGAIGCSKILGFEDRWVAETPEEYEAVVAGDCPKTGCPEGYDYGESDFGGDSHLAGDSVGPGGTPGFGGAFR